MTVRRRLFALAAGVYRLARCRFLGCRFAMVEIPVALQAWEQFGELPRYGEFRLTFENMVRIARMVEPAPRERRCVRCYERDLPRAEVCQ